MISVGKFFVYVNILEVLEIWQSLKEYVNWFIYLQLWVNGELVGGCDIIMEMYCFGQFKELVESVVVEGDV